MKYRKHSHLRYVLKTLYKCCFWRIDGYTWWRSARYFYITEMACERRIKEFTNQMACPEYRAKKHQEAVDRAERTLKRVTSPGYRPVWGGHKQSES